MLTRGRLIRCRRCHGTGYARYNSMNGDTHCYLCNGSGQQRIYSAAERAAMEAEALWFQSAYHDGYHFRLKVRRAARRAGVADRSRAMRTATFWVGDGLERMGSAA